MKAKVQRLFSNGKRLVPHTLAPGLEGELCVSQSNDNRYGAGNLDAWLVKKGGMAILPTLSDVRVLFMGADGLMIRGIEIGDDGQEVRQEWWCEVES
jgi:hypothetical protein